MELDITGELDGIFYEDIAGLAEATRNHPKLSACLINRLYAYGTGGPVSLRHDRDTLAWFEDRFVANGYKLPALLRDIALSDAFSSVRSEETPGKIEDSLRIKSPAESAGANSVLASVENK